MWKSGQNQGGFEGEEKRVEGNKEKKAIEDSVGKEGRGVSSA